jgi:hypothetical protein
VKTYKLLFLSVVFLGSCTTSGLVVEKVVDPNPYPGLFSVCHGYGCLQTTNVGLNADQWEQIESLFFPSAADPADERKRIARAISLLECFTGPLVGTAHDRSQAEAIVFDSGQMDCIDEAVNTTTYLTLLEEQGLFYWHQKQKPARRGFFIDGRWPHNTAVIEEKRTGEKFAVDSWFHPNGTAPEIVQLEAWLRGWHPEKNKDPMGCDETSVRFLETENKLSAVK